MEAPEARWALAGSGLICRVRQGGGLQVSGDVLAEQLDWHASMVSDQDGHPAAGPVGRPSRHPRHTRHLT
jgi:hypothetical protein